tara:strand:+ start:3762 stop:4307 length:546 start_codon:yes stop_codon:yes gene_type:complete
MNIPAFREMGIQVIFYTDSHDRDTQLYQFISRQLITHCGVLFTDIETGERWIHLLNRKRGSRFVSWDKFENILKIYHPEVHKHMKFIDLGKAPVSLAQMAMVDERRVKLSSFIENIFYWAIGRHFSGSYVPITCAYITSRVLNMCGYTNKRHVVPHTLYKELNNGVDNYFWTSEGGEDSSG